MVPKIVITTHSIDKLFKTTMTTAMNKNIFNLIFE